LGNNVANEISSQIAASCTHQLLPHICRNAIYILRHYGQEIMSTFFGNLIFKIFLPARLFKNTDRLAMSIAVLPLCDRPIACEVCSPLLIVIHAV